jgi:hypothetical protein
MYFVSKITYLLCHYEELTKTTLLYIICLNHPHVPLKKN